MAQAVEWVREKWGLIPATGLFRSKAMRYVTITMTNEAAHDTVRELGEYGNFHIVDLANKEQPSKQYTHYKKRALDCGTFERKLAQLEGHMARYGVQLPRESSGENQRHGDVLEALARYLEPIEKEVSLNRNFSRTNQQAISECVEHLHVLDTCRDLDKSQAVDDLEAAVAERRRSLGGGDHIQQPLLRGHDKEKEKEEARFRNVICGTIPTTQHQLFSRMLYRVSRGNTLLRYVEVEQKVRDPGTGQLVNKSVFYLVVLGAQLYRRITKMCSLFSASIYDVPDLPEDYSPVISGLRRDLQDKREVLDQTEQSLRNILRQMAGVEGDSPLREWQDAVRKERSMCEAFMKSHFYLTMISMEGWVPEARLHELRGVFAHAVSQTGAPPAAYEADPQSPLSPPGMPPTYFPTNKFTGVYQNIVDTYGVPRYGEVNPGLFTIITFPFLFGVMYGDIGHGTVQFFVALYMLWNEKKLLKQIKEGKMSEIPTMAFSGRWMLLPMSIFAVYCGLIYNDCFSVPFTLFESTWVEVPEGTGFLNYTGLAHTSKVYPFGVDSNWYHTENELAFFNSMKMKMSVCIGVTHMLFGIVLSMFNHLHKRDMLSVWTEFLPRILFMCCTFGYMVLIIIIKWSIDWCAPGEDCAVSGSRPGQSPPNLIQTMIAMFLSPGSVAKEDQLYSGQAGLQTLLLLIAFACVPWMLVMKPYMLKRRHERGGAHGHVLGGGGGGGGGGMSINNSDGLGDIPLVTRGGGGGGGVGDGGDYAKFESDEEKNEVDPYAALPPRRKKRGGGGDGGAAGGHGHGDGDFVYSDELIHNSIHTIEFVLGAVSNTASYLRLWALSLAHAQLAQVFWSKFIVQYGLETGNPVFVFAGFAAWFGATFAVLLCMDVLECFLHALRLHWVEFQNKFYYADGYAFEPFSFHHKEDGM